MPDDALIGASRHDSPLGDRVLRLEVLREADLGRQVAFERGIREDFEAVHKVLGENNELLVDLRDKTARSAGFWSAIGGAFRGLSQAAWAGGAAALGYAVHWFLQHSDGAGR